MMLQNFNFKIEQESKDKRYANKLEIKEVWQQIKMMLKCNSYLRMKLNKIICYSYAVYCHISLTTE